MKKRILSILLILILCSGLSISVCASSEENFVLDDADLLSRSEEKQLNAKLKEVSAKNNAQILVATIPSLDSGDVNGYIEDMYDSMRLGYGKDRDGVLMLVCMDPREYRILSNGYAGVAITEFEIDLMGDLFVSYLSDGDYAEAFSIYADECDYYLDGYLNGFPFEVGANLLIAVIIGAVVALIVVLILRGQLKSVRKQNQANSYVRYGSMQLTTQNDFFLYRDITRTKIEKNNSSGSSGSSTGRSIGGGSF